jgi:hypothetical protein
MVDLALLQSVSYIAGALGVFIAAIFYVLNLRISQRNSKLALKTQEQTLETRQAQLLMSIFQNYSSKEFQTDMEEMAHVWKWSDYDDFMTRYGMENVKEIGKHATVFQIYEGTGVFVKRGLVNPELVYDLMRESVIVIWEKFSPIIENWRTRYNAPQIYLGFEFLYHEMKKVRDERGHPSTSFGRITP